MAPSPASRANNFDLLRLLAALQVVLVHAGEHFGADMTQPFARVLGAFPGVTIFFVTSGFLIAGAWRRSPSVLDYALNRALRIYPALWVCFALSLAISLWLFRAPLSGAELARWSVAQLSAGQFYNPEALRAYGVGTLNGSLWTIPVELQFYAVLPFVLVALDRVGWRTGVVVGLMLALALANRLLVWTETGEQDLAAKLYRVSLAPHLWAFLCGVLAHRHSAWLVPLLRRHFVALLVLYAVAAWAFGRLGLENDGNLINPLLVALLGSVAIGFAHVPLGRHGSPTRGHDLSYGLYLYHMPVVNVLLFLGVESLGRGLAVTLAASFGAALLSWHLVERPALSLKRRTSRPEGGRPPEPHDAEPLTRSR